MNKQPFYHRIDGLLFTSVNGISESDFLRILRNSTDLKRLGVLADTIEVEPNGWQEPEAGDPQDLV